MATHSAELTAVIFAANCMQIATPHVNHVDDGRWNMAKHN
jgi:hypothetical protein